MTTKGITIYFQKNTIPRVLTLCVIVVVVVLWVIHFVDLDPRALALRITVLFVGTINGNTLPHFANFKDCTA
jgi:hypothetical protein